MIGVDVGPIPGLACLDFSEPGLLEVQLAQTTPELCLLIAEALIREADEAGTRVIVQGERFVVGRRAARSSSAGAGETTRSMIGGLAAVCTRHHVRFIAKAAGNVKPWATNDRIARAGIKVPKGMTHAGDGVRHALFAAVHDGGIPDPLSKDWCF